jgi:hypothetical protein
MDKNRTRIHKQYIQTDRLLQLIHSSSSRDVYTLAAQNRTAYYFASPRPTDVRTIIHSHPGNWRGDGVLFMLYSTSNLLAASTAVAA